MKNDEKWDEKRNNLSFLVELCCFPVQCLEECWHNNDLLCLCFNILRSGVLSDSCLVMTGTTWNCCRLSACSAYTIQSCTSLQCHFIESHIIYHMLGAYIYIFMSFSQCAVCSFQTIDLDLVSESTIFIYIYYYFLREGTQTVQQFKDLWPELKCGFAFFCFCFVANTPKSAGINMTEDI